jgi:hypothetical protein
MQTADACQAGLWNANDTMLLVRNTEATTFVKQFNPTSFSVQTLPYSTRDQVCFSKVNPAILYTLEGSRLFQNIFTEANGAWVFSASELLYDFAVALPAGFKIESTSVFSVSYDDSTFSIGFSSGIQNTGIYVALWNRTKGYRLINLNTGAVEGGFGTTGRVRITSSNYKLPMTFHEVYMAMNPEYTIINPYGTSDTSLIWENDGLNLIDNEAAGHKAYGRQGYFAGGPGGGQLAYGTYTKPTVHGMVVKPANLPAAAGQKYLEDMHMGIGKVTAGDDALLCVGSGGNGPMPFTSAWENEIRLYDPVAGVVYRLCHTMDSNRSKEFIVQNAIPVISQTGKFVAFTSDWMGALGSNVTQGDGTLGVDAAGDVFIAAVTD